MQNMNVRALCLGILLIVASGMFAEGWGDYFKNLAMPPLKDGVMALKNKVVKHPVYTAGAVLVGTLYLSKWWNMPRKTQRLTIGNINGYEVN